MIKLDGIGKDAEIVENENGGLQSKAIGYFHYVDPLFLYGYFETYHREAGYIVDYLNKEIDIETLANDLCFSKPETLLLIAKTMEYGAIKGNKGKGYPKDNWRKISEDDHINHALAHLYAAELGDTQDDHIAHFYTRIMMAYAVHYQKEN